MGFEKKYGFAPLFEKLDGIGILLLDPLQNTAVIKTKFIMLISNILPFPF